jgi:hypothetical protein
MLDTNEMVQEKTEWSDFGVWPGVMSLLGLQVENQQVESVFLCTDTGYPANSFQPSSGSHVTSGSKFGQSGEKILRCLGRTMAGRK